MNPAGMPGSELGQSAVQLLDKSLELARRTPVRELFVGMVPGLGLGFLALALYYVERVEGIRSLRIPFALAFGVAYALRAVMLGRWAGRRATELLAAHRVDLDHGPASTLVRAAVWVGFDLWFWAWLLVLAVHLDPWFVPLMLPILCVRGSLVPSWLCCADAEAGSGFSALRRALEQSEGQRLRGLSVELMLLLGALGIAFNLLALGVGAVSIGQDMLGLDLSFVSAFLSHKNHFALLFVLVLSLAVMEPLRGALSAAMFSDALLAKEGIALRSLVIRAEERDKRVPRAAVLLLCAFTLGGDVARAQDNAPVEADGGVQAAPCEGACAAARAADDDIRDEVEAILADPAFAEFPEAEWSDTFGNDVLTRWLEAFLRSLNERDESQNEPRDPSQKGLNLPASDFFLVAALVLAVLALFFWLRRKKGAPDEPPEQVIEQDPLERSAEAHLDDAMQHAGLDLRLALRSLYLATLVGLERRGLLTLSPERTNGQYLRTLPRGDDRSMFASFTRIFDAVQYGARDPSQDDYATCRALAERLVTGGASP